MNELFELGVISEEE